MFERLKPKVKTSITIDQDLHEELKKIKEENEVESLSPMINEMLWSWIKSQENKNE